MGTLPNKLNTNRAARLVTAITLAVGVLAFVGGIVEYIHPDTGDVRADAIITAVVGLACGVIGLRVKFGGIRRTELAVLACALPVLVIVETWLSATPMHLFGLAIPAALVLLLTTGAS